MLWLRTNLVSIIIASVFVAMVYSYVSTAPRIALDEEAQPIQRTAQQEPPAMLPSDAPSCRGVMDYGKLRHIYVDVLRDGCIRPGMRREDVLPLIDWPNSVWKVNTTQTGQHTFEQWVAHECDFSAGHYSSCYIHMRDGIVTSVSY